VAEVLKIECNDTTSPARLIVSGEVDLCTIDQFAVALSDVAARHSRILIDLTEVDFLACVGIDVLYNYTNLMTAVLVRRGSITARALALCDFGALVAVHRADPPRRSVGRSRFGAPSGRPAQPSASPA
jgi:anti-anti-sigma factor